MPELHLNDRSLRNLETSKKQEDFKDSSFTVGEFGVRVSFNGSKRFFVRYRVNGKRRRMMLGAYPGISLADARKRAHKLCVETADGSDPAKVKLDRKKAGDVRSFFDAFMAQKQQSFVRSTYTNYLSMWNKDCEKYIGDMKVEDVERHHIVELLDRIEARTDAPHMVNRTRTLLMSLFNWGVAKGRCKYNPVLGVPKAQKRELPGERFLSRNEIKLYWQVTEGLPVRERVYWRLLILLALRPGEVSMLRWSWIDGEVLTIPASVVKNKREHKLFLTAFTREQISSLQQYSDSEFLFPRKYSDSHQKIFLESHKNILGKMNVDPWTPRDIRRTCETQMRTFIRDGEGISRVLNHDISAIRKHYDRGDYFERKIEVLTKWTEWLKALLRQESNNVVAIEQWGKRAITLASK